MYIELEITKRSRYIQIDVLCINYHWIFYNFSFSGLTKPFIMDSKYFHCYKGHESTICCVMQKKQVHMGNKYTNTRKCKKQNKKINYCCCILAAGIVFNKTPS